MGERVTGHAGRSRVEIRQDGELAGRLALLLDR